MSKVENGTSVEATYLKAERALRASGVDAMLRVICGQPDGEGNSTEKDREEQRALEADHEIVQAVFESRGPVVAVKALIRLRSIPQSDPQSE